MHVSENVPLAPLTTLRLGGPARRLVTAERERALVDTIQAVESLGEQLLVLGGGSNLVVADAGFDGTVLRIATRGRKIEYAHDKAIVTVQAGEPWDAFVASCIEEGLSGVECLAGIPGLVGAVPMQNVGAYGQDVSETIVKVRAYDRQTRTFVDIDRAGCGFSYRSSAFRGRDRYVILDVTFELTKSRNGRPIRYAELARALAVNEGDVAPAATIRSTVIELRKKKGMVIDSGDPDTTSAGSFFTNPILDPLALDALRARVALGTSDTMPVFPEADGRSKVSAAWLIERAGFTKGFTGPSGRVGISTKHALALTNRGAGTTRELIDLARTIRDGVFAKFGVKLENEPVLVGVHL